MGIKYIVDNVSGQTISGDLTINGNVVITGTTNTRPYKVYTALLTQSGSGDTQNLSSGAVTKGVTYQISGVGFDCTNVGAPNNDNGTYFVATNNEVPTAYGAGSLVYKTGTPVVTMLENTLGVVPIWDYVGPGQYNLTSVGTFTTNKTAVILTPSSDVGVAGTLRQIGSLAGDEPNSIQIISFDSTTGIFTDGLLTKYFIEIRVYN